MTDHVPAPFGPDYPALPSIEKFRRKAAAHGSDPFFTDAYGAAVHEAIRTLQRQELMRAGINRSEAKCQCASGTNFNDGKQILRAVAAQNRAAATRINFPTDKSGIAKWQKMQQEKYAAAMAEKRAR